MDQKSTIRTMRSYFRSARNSGWTIGELYNALDELIKDLRKDTPKCQVQITQAIRDVLWDEMMSRDLELVYLYKGEMYSTNKETKFLRKLTPEIMIECRKNPIVSAYRWIDTNKNFTEFAEEEKTNESLR
jgi:hypothetical protein